MNRPLTAVFAALEALLVVGIGIGIPLVPLTLLWAFQYGLAINWLVFWRASVDIWLLGSGADVSVTLDPSLAASAGLGNDTAPQFVLTIALLGFALLTVLLGVRAGRRIAETPYRQFGVAVTILTFAALALTVTATALHPAARPSVWQGCLVPTVVYAVGVVTGAEITRRRSGVPDENGSSLRDWVNDWPPSIRAAIGTALRAGTAAIAMVLAVASVIATVLIVFGYAKIISLYEEVHAGILGGITLTIGQLAIVPNMVVWTASWLVGPGFAIGTGSTVSPLGTQLGPIPAIPVFGALPTGELTYGFLGLLVPILAGFFAGVIVQPRLQRTFGGNPARTGGNPARTGGARGFGDRGGTGTGGKTVVGRLPLGWLAATGALTGVAGGILLGLLAWASAGAAGPGRLADVGPSPVLVALFVAIEVGIAATLGLLAADRRVATDREVRSTADSSR